MAAGTLPILLLLVGLPGSTAHAMPAPRSEIAPHRLRVALALSGGGARGIAHIGVIRAFEDNGIPIDAVAGTSMGALVGAFYASGRRGSDLQRVVSSLDWSAVFGGRPDRRLLPVARRPERDRTFAGLGLENWKPRLPAGALPEYGINRFLIEHLAEAGFAADDDFDRLPIPFRAVAAALDNRERLVLARGSLPRAVRASLSIPVAFPPVDWNGRTLVDGGIVDNLPTREARSFGASIVIAVDISSPPLEPERYHDVLGVAAQLSGLLTDRANDDYRAEADVLIKPDLGRHSFNDYAGLEDLIARGYAAGVAAIPDIRRRLAAAPDGAAARASTEPPGPGLSGRPIAEIRVEGNRRVSERVIRRVFNVPLGPPFDVGKALKALDKLHATGLFDHCWLDFEKAGADLRVVLRVREAPMIRAEVGASYDQATRARGVLKLRKRNTFGFGEEGVLTLWASDAGNGIRGRLLGERLLTPALGFEVELEAQTERPRFYEGGDYVSRASFRRREASFRINRAIKRWALVEAGLRLGDARTGERLGLAFSPGKDAVRTARGAVTIDNRDDSDLPTAGELFFLGAEQTLPGLGADRDYRKLTARGQVARALSARGTIEAAAFIGLSSGPLPAYDLFRIGGPDLVPGRDIDELWGPQALGAAVAFRLRTVGQLRAVARIGTGQVFASRAAIRGRSLPAGFGLGLIYPTRFGPLRVDLGIVEDGHRLITFALGAH